MKYNVIGSNSKGNAIIIEDKILLDCGVSFTKLKKHMKDIKLIFISHVHKDHILPKTIELISYNYPSIKYLCGSHEVVKKLVCCGVDKKNIYVLPSQKWYDLGLCKIKLELLVHDTPNFALKLDYNNQKLIYIVDTNEVAQIIAKNYNLYLIEANYNEELLEQHIQDCINNQDDENKLYYLERVKKTHLSYEKANDFLINNMGESSGYKYIHKSNYNFKED